MLHRKSTLLAVAVAAWGGVAAAQAPAATGGPKVGDVAPDFTLKGSTKDGLLAKPVHLADLKGQVVVLAFFPKARTKG